MVEVSGNSGELPDEAASGLSDGLGGPMTDFDYVMEGLGELARLTGPNDAAQYALAALDMKKQLDRYREALEKINKLEFRMGWHSEAMAITKKALKDA